MKVLIVAFAAGALAVAQTATPPQTPQQQAPVFRSTTTVVPLTVTVLDKKGVPVADLKQADFKVLENDKPREILNFFPQAFAQHVQQRCTCVGACSGAGWRSAGE